MKAILAPIYFPATNERERGEFQDQMKVLKEMYGDVAEFLEPVAAGETVSAEADAIVFPQMIFEAFRIADKLAAYDMPMVVLTSRFGTVEM